MPLARNALFSLVFAFTAVLPAASWADDAPVDLSKERIDEQTRDAFKLLGYKLDEQKHQILAPDGKPLGQEKFKDLQSPCSLKTMVFSDEERSQLLLGGCRFDTDADRVFCLDAKSKKKFPVTNLLLEAIHKEASLSSGHNILERLDLLLAKTAADKPVPPETLAQLKSMLANSPGAAVPPAVVKALNAPGATAGDARVLVDNAYRDSTRFFDGQTTVGEGFKAAFPVFPGWGEPKRPPQFFDDQERKLGNALRDSAAAHFARSPVGRELLENFKDARGKIKLPPFLILNIDPRAGAVYNFPNKTVVVNQQYVIDGLTADMPAAQRDALREQLKDSKKFAAYLLAHPEAREAFLKQNDVAIFHELTHAVQDKRDGLLGAMGKGESPSAIHLEYEHEAFMAENRYMHWKVTHEPASAMSDADLAPYMEELADFDKFRDGITQQYLESFPTDAADFKTVNQLQSERVSMARRLMGENLHSALIEGLKLIGLARGTEEIKKTETAESKRTAAFLKNDYPKMQEEGRRGLVEVFLLRAKAAKNPAMRDSDLLTAQSWAEASGDPKLIAKVKEAKENPK